MYIVSILLQSDGKRSKCKRLGSTRVSCTPGVRLLRKAISHKNRREPGMEGRNSILSGGQSVGRPEAKQTEAQKHRER